MWPVPPCTPAVQRIIVMRHGERRDGAPDAPVEADPPLTEAGKAEVAQASAELQGVLGADAAARLCLVSSPFARTLQTAVELRRHNIGTHAGPHGQDSGLVVDHGFCEVYGPVRIKGEGEPELWQLAELMLPVPHDALDQDGRSDSTTVVGRLDGELPRWGETLEAAAVRYVAAFQRIADEHTVAAAAVTAAAKPAHRRLPLRHRGGGVAGHWSVASSQAISLCSAYGAASEPRSETAPASTPTSAVQAERAMRDVLIVTHGDALHILLNHFYPARTVYNADYLSFLVFVRHGWGNPVFHLESAHGVQWIVDGNDEEPADSYASSSSPSQQPPQMDDALRTELAYVEALWRRSEAAEALQPPLPTPSSTATTPTTRATVTPVPAASLGDGGATGGRFAAAVGVDAAAERASRSSSTAAERRPRLPRRRPQRVAAPVLMSIVGAEQSEFVAPSRSTPSGAALGSTMKDSLSSTVRRDEEVLSETAQPKAKLRPNGNEGCIRSCRPDGTPMQSSSEFTTLRARGVGPRTGALRRLGTAVSRWSTTGMWRTWALLFLLRGMSALVGIFALTYWPDSGSDVARSFAAAVVVVEVGQGALFVLSFRSARAYSMYMLSEQLHWTSSTAAERLATAAYATPEADVLDDVDDGEEDGSHRAMTPGGPPDSTSTLHTTTTSFALEGADKQGLLCMTNTVTATREAGSSAPYSTSSSGTAVYDIAPQSDSLSRTPVPMQRLGHASHMAHRHQAGHTGGARAVQLYASLWVFLRRAAAAALRLVLIVVLAILCCTLVLGVSWDTLCSSLHDASLQAYLVLLAVWVANVIRGCVEVHVAPA